MKLRYFLLCFLYILTAPFVFGQASTIKINEFLIEPTPQVVEILNTGSEIVDLSNWYIDDNGGTTYFTVPSNTLLYPNACVSFEGLFNLNKTSSDAVRLFDSTAPPTSLSAHLIDSFDYKASSGSGVTFQRIPDGMTVWTTGSATLDKYNLTGLACKYVPSPTSTPTPPEIPTVTPTPIITTLAPTLTPTLTPTPTPTSTPELKAIYLSEVYPYPDTNENEWIELFNDNAFPVFLDNWKIDDVSNAGSTPKKFSITIPSYSFKSVDLSSSIFNNDGDEVRLLNSDDRLVDSFVYDGAEKSKSIGRISFTSNSYCLQNSSKERSNDSCLNDITPTPKATSTATPTPSLLSDGSNGAVLGEYFGNNVAVDYVESVRPTQYYIRPTIDADDDFEEATNDSKNKTDNYREEDDIEATRAAAFISTIVSFLTAGFLFIRIML